MAEIVQTHVENVNSDIVTKPMVLVCMVVPKDTLHLTVTNVTPDIMENFVI